MKQIMLFLLLLSLLAVACGGDEDVAETAVSNISGPALVMFYTDN